MKCNIPRITGGLLACAVASSLFFTGQPLWAHPYASGITNNGGTVSFILNENADSVKVAFDSMSVTNDLTPLGQTNRGVNTFSLGAHTDFAIIVSKAGTGIPSLISPGIAAPNTNLSFYGGRSVALNNNPASRRFGRIYVANANGGSAAPATRAVGRGLYALNPDYSDALGYGTNPAPAQANFPAGGAHWWGSSTTYAPYRIHIGEDDTVWVGDSAGSGTVAGAPVWKIDPELTTPVEAFAYNGATGGSNNNSGPCQSKPFMTGTLGQGNLVLTCLMWNYIADGGTYQSILRYNIGAGPIDSANSVTMVPSIVVTNVQPGFGATGANGVTEDLVVATNGYIYVAFNRANGGGLAAGNNELFVFDSTGTRLWASSDPNTGGVTNGVTTSATNDWLQANSIQPIGLAISPDNQYLGFGNNQAANWALVKLTNGIPDKSSLIKVTASNSGMRGPAFDLANNFYTVEGNSDALKVYSLGQSTTCITSNNAALTAGSFSVLLPATTVSIAATTAQASQGNPTPAPGVFTITRSGQLTSPLTVNYSLAGTASNSTYTVTGGTTTNVTLAVGQASTNVIITPIHDNVPRLTTTVVLNLAGGASYSTVPPLSATVNIQNTATPQLIVSAGAPTAYKRYTNDYASVTITRLGDTNATFPITTFSLGGTAVQNTDYAVLADTTLGAGVITTNARILRPLNPPEPVYAGHKTVVVTLNANGSTYTSMPGSNSTTLTILDDAYPPAEVLYANPLTDPNDAPNWNLTAVIGNTSFDPDPGQDYKVDFGFDLTTGLSGGNDVGGKIPLPPSGATTALRLTANKGHANEAAVNAYLANHAFSGDYAVRFNIYLVQGASVGSSTATEGALFGINHDGTQTNWWAGSATTPPGLSWSADGVWYWLCADPGGSTAGDYQAFNPITNALPNTGWVRKPAALFTTSFQNVFKNPCFTAGNATSNSLPGLPANQSPWIAADVNGVGFGSWADVEIKQVNNFVTLSINKTQIFTVQNTNTLFQGGTVMLGYEDPFNSAGTMDSAAYYSNLRVVRLGPPAITGSSVAGNNISINFVSVDGNDTINSFALQSSATVNGTYTDVSPAATFTQDPATGSFTAVSALNGPMRFYRVRHK